MAIEIERKFLVTSNEYESSSQVHDIKQAYLSIADNLAIRVRLDEIHASICIKSKVSDRINREYEYSIPNDEAKSLIKLSKYSIIHKTRYMLDYKGFTWEIDKFHSDNMGLVIAEIELDDKDEIFDKPPWVGKEVTSDYRYLNSNLAIHPFNSW